MEIVSSILALTLFLIILASYSRSKHKSRKLSGESKRITAPGPPGAWPLIGHLHLLRGRAPLARILGALADKHGPIVSLKLGTRPALVVSSWEMVRECFTTNDRNFATRPSMAAARFMGQNNALFGLAPYGPYWRYVRKMVTMELLTSHRLEKMKHIRASEYNNWIKDLYFQCGKDDDVVPAKVVLNEWFELLTFNIIIRMLAGKRFSTSSETKNNDEDQRLKGAVKKALYLTGVFVYSDVIPWIEWLDIGGYIKSMKQAGKDLDRVLGDWLEEHILEGKSPHIQGEADFMDVMLSAIPENGVISGHKRDAIIKATTAVIKLKYNRQVSSQ